MGSYRSKEDEVLKIATSIFITNFPDSFGAKDLWNTCKQYGHVVDAYIPYRRSKAGKRFGFVRFIKVLDVDRLVNNLCTVWVGRHKIQANIPRFQREPLNKHSSLHNNNGVKRGNSGDTYNINGVKGASNSYAHAVKGSQNVKDFATLANLKVVVANEGFDNVKFKYMGRYWVMMEFQTEKTKLKFQANLVMNTWFSQIILASSDFTTYGRVTWVEIKGIPLNMWSKNTFSRVASKWGDLLDVDDQEDKHFHRKRICINTNVLSNIFESFKLIYRGKVVWVRAKEVPSWIPDFVEDNEDEEDEEDGSYEDIPNGEDVKNVEDLEGDSDGEAVPDTKFGEESPNQKGEEDSIGHGIVQSVDPFNIYELLNQKRPATDKNSNSKDLIKYPPGYTPTRSKVVTEEKKFDSKKKSKNDVEESICSGYFKKSEVSKTGGSILQLIEDLVKVGETMGYDMKGCMMNMEEIIELQGENDRLNWSLLSSFVLKGVGEILFFDYVYSTSVGNSGGILCVWDYFVMVRGDWMPNGKKLLIISVYAPQELTEKKMLWDYLSIVISNWEGKVVIIGDFNEVRNKSKRFGTTFNRHGADVFNSFIFKAGLEEVSLEGCSFTWYHRSATKMSKLDRFLISDSLLCSCPNISSITLDRYLSDHHPILMREVYYDYGPVLFRFFHYWFEVDGFDKFIKDSWKDALIIKSNALVRMMKKPNKRSLIVELADCDAIIDKGEGESNVVNRRMKAVNLLQEVEKMKALEAAQKAKIKWAIEGDENSKYYHGVINKKRNQLSIRGILVEGTWIDYPPLVKSEFLSHFKNRFEQPNGNRLHMDMHFSNTLNSDQVADLECQVSKEEIKKAVWDCGIDKSPGPDGFTFGFYRRYWNLIENDVVDAVTCFFHQGSFPKGGNSSFIILIPKTPNANMVKDYRPISLIGSMYKIISKILANRLVVVLGGLVNEIQSAFVADKQILDGPFILNELVQWCKKKKKQSMVFKVDFEKAYDSVRWDHLDDIMRKFGFGEKWCMWIQSCLRSSRGSVIVNGSPTEEFQFYKGLKQGDPLSPFLFILVMESLHISFQRVVDVGLFKGIELAHSLNLSHMFYADDAIFMGQWSEANIDTIVQVLECFYRASGLRINMSKSKLLGIYVEEDKVEQAPEGKIEYLGSKLLFRT
ncbi:RNA-directed DNA polymerase, eukaryota [Tanacetum coccineum]